MAAVDEAMELRRARLAEFRRSGDDGIDVRLQGQTLYLDGVGAFLWKVFDGRMTVGQVIDEVAKVYDVDPNLVRDDVLEFAVEMRDLGFLVSA